MAVDLVYETHSISVDNETGHATGWLSGELSERGIALAAELGDRRRDDGLAVVFTSDLRRATQTADVAFAGTAIPVRADARLRECDYGDWNGAPLERIEPERPRRVDTPFPGGQSYRDVVDRMAGFLADLARDWDGRRVLVIGHAATRWSLQHLLDGEALEALVQAPFAWRPGWHFVVPTGWRRPPVA